MSSTVASASSAPASPLRSRGRAPPVDDRPTAFSVAFEVDLAPPATPAPGRTRCRSATVTPSANSHDRRDRCRCPAPAADSAAASTSRTRDAPRRGDAGRPRRRSPTATQAFDSSCRSRRAAAGAERRADGDLLLALERARQQQVGDVRADDQQHEHDGAEQHEQRRPQLRADERVGEARSG